MSTEDKLTHAERLRLECLAQATALFTMKGGVSPDVVLKYAKDYEKYLLLAEQKPFLGLATTRQLLGELEARMKDTQNSTSGRDLGVLCGEALKNLDSGVLNYKTTGQGGQYQ